MASHIVRPSVVVKGARENLGHVVPADQDFPMQAVCGRRWRLARDRRPGVVRRTWAKPGGGDRARADPLPHLGV